MEVTGQEHDDFKNLPIRENLLTRMQDAGVTLSVNLPVVSKPQNQAEVNRFAKEVCPERTSFSFGGLHPDCENVVGGAGKTEGHGRWRGSSFIRRSRKSISKIRKYEEMWRRINALGFPVLIHLRNCEDRAPV